MTTRNLINVQQSLLLDSLMFPLWTWHWWISWCIYLWIQQAKRKHQFNRCATFCSIQASGCLEAEAAGEDPNQPKYNGVVLMAGTHSLPFFHGALISIKSFFRIDRVTKSPRPMVDSRLLRQCEVAQLTSSCLWQSWCEATVKGDVHDIGKNIVGVVLGCNNYKVNSCMTGKGWILIVLGVDQKEDSRRTV